MVVCKINFENNPQNVYYSGQLIRGTVQLTLSERKKVRGVYIKFKGNSDTEWYEDVQKEEGIGENRKTVTVREWYRSNENYLSSKSFFVGGDDGTMYLEAGEYVYNFELQLPLELPSSFEGDFGNIRYGASVVLIIPWGIDDKFKESFTVIRALDLNLYPSLREPVSDVTEFNSYPCCLLCCFPSDPLNIIARIPVGGYAPGQTINLTLEVDNKSNQRVPQFKMELIKHIKYHAQGHTKIQEFCRTAQESSRGVEVNQKRIIRINLRIPPNPPSDETNCGIIKISYLIFVTADMGTCCSDPKIHLPITIGTKPIDDFLALDALDEHHPSAPVPSAPVVTDQPRIQPSAPPMDTMDNGEKIQDLAPPYPDDDLPTYEESTDPKGSTGNNEFKPKYPVFNRQTSYSKN